MAITEQFPDELAEEDKAISHERLLVRVILTLFYRLFLQCLEFLTLVKLLYHTVI